MAPIACQPRNTFLEFYGDETEKAHLTMKRTNSVPDLSSSFSSPIVSMRDQVYAETLIARAHNLSFLQASKPDNLDAASDTSTMSPTDDWSTWNNEKIEQKEIKLGWKSQAPQKEQTMQDAEHRGLARQWLDEGLTIACVDTLAEQIDQGSRECTTENMALPENATTLMICNIPCMIVPQQLVSAIDSVGFSSKYDLVYLPAQLCADERKSANLGYGFVNFKTSKDAREFQDTFTGYQFSNTCSKKVCTVKVARLQGFEANMKAASRALKHKTKNGTVERIEYMPLKNTLRPRTKPLLLPMWDAESQHYE